VKAVSAHRLAYHHRKANGVMARQRCHRSWQLNESGVAYQLMKAAERNNP
jgi:hypothetical protein